MTVLFISLISLFVLFFVYKRTPYLKLLAHNVLGILYNLKNSIKTKKVIDLESDRAGYDIRCANAVVPMSLKSYIGNNQNVHPKVLFFKEGFGGHKFWMAYTPFPWYIDCYENPCIAFSEDGYNWTNIADNPIDDPHKDGYDSDTHLVYREDIERLECWYRYVGNYKKPPVTERILRRTSKDGISWSEPELIYENTSGEYARLMSPSILWDGSKYQIWVINKYNDFSIDLYDWQENKRSFELVQRTRLSCVATGDSTKYKPWHLDVIRERNELVFLIMCKEEKGSGTRRWDLFMTGSINGTDFTTPELVLHGSEQGWDRNIYRASLVNVEGEYRIYYSALNLIGKHGIGITTSNHLGEFVGQKN